VNTPGDSAWTLLGFAARVPGGWELNGLTLPRSGRIRALGRAEGSLMEEVTQILTPRESWRLQHFSTSDNSGPAADDADPDKDGLTNLTEFAFGLNPAGGSGANALPEFKYDGASFSATFTAPEGREDVVYGAEWSSAMQPGTWTAIPDTGMNGTHLFGIPAQGHRLFVRFVVRNQPP
jgi:hypothetical protein